MYLLSKNCVSEACARDYQLQYWPGTNSFIRSPPGFARGLKHCTKQIHDKLSNRVAEEPTQIWPSLITLPRCGVMYSVQSKEFELATPRYMCLLHAFFVRVSCGSAPKVFCNVIRMQPHVSTGQACVRASCCP